MAKKLGYAQWGLILLGIALGYAGWQLGLPFLIGVGVAVGGLGIAAGGGEDMITRRVGLVYGDEQTHDQTYHGTSAVLLGVMWLVVGATLFLGGMAYALGLGETLLSYFSEHPGPALILAGLAMMAYGGVETLGAREDRLSRSFLAFLGSVPARIFGLILAVVGLAALAAGLLEMVAPGTFDAVLAQLSESLLPRIPE